MTQNVCVSIVLKVVFRVALFHKKIKIFFIYKMEILIDDVNTRYLPFHIKEFEIAKNYKTFLITEDDVLFDDVEQVISCYDFYKYLSEEKESAIGVLREILYNVFPGKEYSIEFPTCTYATLKTTPFSLKVREIEIEPKNKEPPFDFKDCINSRKKVISFLSKSGKSILVSPCYRTDRKDRYHTISQFTRYATPQLQTEFWKTVSTVLLNEFKRLPRMYFQPLTDGRDIYWLHFKIFLLRNYNT